MAVGVLLRGMMEMVLVTALTLYMIVMFGNIVRKSPNTLQAKKTPGYLSDRLASLIFRPGKQICHTGREQVKPWHTKSTYTVNRYKFESELKKVLSKTSRHVEGHSGTLAEMTKVYLSIVNTSSFIRTVCETGFNAGHSSLSWLMGSTHTHVYSFDLGNHAYSRPMAAYLQATFPGRLTMTWGNSKTTIPAFIKQHPHVRCDLIVVDGGHSYHVADADLSNFSHLANKVNLLIVDDIRYSAVRNAWRKHVKSKYVQEHSQCVFSNSHKSFVVGKYINH